LLKTEAIEVPRQRGSAMTTVDSKTPTRPATEQRTARWGPGSAQHSSASVEWETPVGLYQLLHSRFRFELDAAATAANTKCEVWFDKGDNGLAQDWKAPSTWHERGARGRPRQVVQAAHWSAPKAVWLNPPYGSKVGKWLEKAYIESNQGLTVVVLIMACTDTIYWHDFVGKAAHVSFLKRRLRFIRDDGYTGTSAPKGSALVVFTPSSDGPPVMVNWDPSSERA